MSAPAARPTVILTRPAEQATAWQDGLRTAGWPVQALPLIEIGPAADPQALRDAVGDWTGADAVMFVSPAAVHAVQAAGVVPPPARLRCWAPGAGTARALRTWGVAPDAIDQPPPDAPQMDSEALWPVVASQIRPGYRLWIVHGLSASGHAGRDWLRERCRSVGADVRRVAAYRRQPPAWDAGQRAAARSWVDADTVWLFSSSEAVAHLRDLLPGAPWSRATALTTHPRIADAARALGFGRVQVCPPTLPGVVLALESLV